MTNKKTVYFKNPHRNIPEDKSRFIPAHKQSQIGPVVYNRPTFSNQVNMVPSRFPGNPDQVTNELYDSLSASSGGLPREMFMNPLQETISTVDGDDDFDNIEVPNNIMYPPVNGSQINESPDMLADVTDVADILSSLEDGSYLLLVEGNAICSGPLDQIEDEVSALIYGHHELCDGEPINPNAVSVVKKMTIKVGAFLE